MVDQDSKERSRTLFMKQSTPFLLLFTTAAAMLHYLRFTFGSEIKV